MSFSNDFYNKNLKEFSRELRSNTVSRAEKYIWKSLLSRKQMGVKFKRQRPLNNFIVDFMSQEIGLVIEIDGNSHVSKGNYDRFRQNKIESFGYHILRFSEGEVLNQLDDVATQIEHAIHVLKSH
jgi:very-short-patch-repair endonuclease